MARSRVLDASLGYLKQNFPNSRVTAFSDQDDELRVPGINLDELDVTELLGQVRPRSDVSQPGFLQERPQVSYQDRGSGGILADPQMSRIPGVPSPPPLAVSRVSNRDRDKVEKPLSFMQKVAKFGKTYGDPLITAGNVLASTVPGSGVDPWTGAMQAFSGTLDTDREREQAATIQRAEEERQRRRDELAEKDYMLRERRFLSEEDRNRAEDEVEENQRKAKEEIENNLRQLYDNASVEGLSQEEANARTISASQRALNEATINQNVGLAQVLEQRLQRLMPEGQQMELTWSTAYDPNGNMKRVGIDPRTGISYVNDGGEITSINLDNWSTSAPDKETAAQAGAVERMDNRLGRAGGTSHIALVADNQDVSLTGAVPPTQAEVAQALGFDTGVVNQEEYEAFIRNPENIDYWKDPTVTGNSEQREALAKALAAQIVSDPNGMSNQGFLRKTFMGVLKSSDWVTEDALKAYVNSLNFINPVVRFLSGAQMTNQEALRYYSALVPMPGEPISVTKLKRERRTVLLNAMGLDATTGDTLAADDPAIIEALNRMGMDPAGGPLQDMNTLGLPEGERRIQGNRMRDAYIGGLENAIPIEAGLVYNYEDYDSSGYGDIE